MMALLDTRKFEQYDLVTQFPKVEHELRLPELRSPFANISVIVDDATPNHRRDFYSGKFWEPMKSVLEDCQNLTPQTQSSEVVGLHCESTSSSIEQKPLQRKRLSKLREFGGQDGKIATKRCPTQEEPELLRDFYVEETEQKIYSVVYRVPVGPPIRQCRRFENHHLQYLLNSKQPSRQEYRSPTNCGSLQKSGDPNPQPTFSKPRLLKPTPVQSNSRRLEFEVLLISTRSDRTTVLGRQVRGLSVKKAKAREAAQLRPWRTWRSLNTIKNAEETRKLVNKFLRGTDAGELEYIVGDDNSQTPPPSPSDSTDYQRYTR